MVSHYICQYSIYFPPSEWPVSRLTHSMPAVALTISSGTSDIWLKAPREAERTELTGDFHSASLWCFCFCHPHLEGLQSAGSPSKSLAKRSGGSPGKFHLARKKRERLLFTLYMISFNIHILFWGRLRSSSFTFYMVGNRRTGYQITYSRSQRANIWPQVYLIPESTPPIPIAIMILFYYL